MGLPGSQFILGYIVDISSGVGVQPVDEDELLLAVVQDRAFVPFCRSRALNVLEATAYPIWLFCGSDAIIEKVIEVFWFLNLIKLGSLKIVPTFWFVGEVRMSSSSSATRIFAKWIHP